MCPSVVTAASSPSHYHGSICHLSSPSLQNVCRTSCDEAKLFITLLLLVARRACRDAVVVPVKINGGVYVCNELWSATGRGEMTEREGDVNMKNILSFPGPYSRRGKGKRGRGVRRKLTYLCVC
jgi:hypothetical protein